MFKSHIHRFYYTNPFWGCHMSTTMYYGEIMNIRDLADIVSRMGWEYDIILKLMTTVYRNDGDMGIIMLFYKMTDLRIDNIRRGHYIMTYQKYQI